MMKPIKIIPNFSVRSVSETIKFYQNILDVKVKMVVLEENHTIEDHFVETEEYSYAMVYKNNLNMMFLKESTFVENVPHLEDFDMGASVLFYMDIERIDEFYKALQEKGVKVVKELTTTWYGIREFYIEDCNGYIIAFTEEV